MSNKFGAHTDFRPLENEDKEVFEQAMKDLVGVGYRPAAVATAVVNGTAYCFFCNATPVVLNPTDFLALVYIVKTFDGQVKINKIAKLIEE